MSTRTCEQVMQALERGSPDPGGGGELARHLRSCPACADALGVAGRLRRAARDQPPRAGLQSASQLWWRAQIIRDLVARESMVERATRATRWSQGIALALVSLLAAVALTWLTAGLLGGLPEQLRDGSVPWRWLAGLLLAGTLVPLAGFSALWLLWRET